MFNLFNKNKNIKKVIQLFIGSGGYSAEMTAKFKMSTKSTLDKLMDKKEFFDTIQMIEFEAPDIMEFRIEMKTNDLSKIGFQMDLISEIRDQLLSTYEPHQKFVKMTVSYKNDIFNAYDMIFLE